MLAYYGTQVQRLIETLTWEQEKHKRIDAEHKVEISNYHAELKDKDERLSVHQILLCEAQQEAVRLAAELTDTQRQLDKARAELQHEHDERIRWQAAKEATSAELVAIRSQLERFDTGLPTDAITT